MVGLWGPGRPNRPRAPSLTSEVTALWRDGALTGGSARRAGAAAGTSTSMTRVAPASKRRRPPIGSLYTGRRESRQAGLEGKADVKTLAAVMLHIAAQRE